jgi:SAM-dependent methyltransferase
MDFKDIVKTGYNQIAKRYLATRTTDSDDVRLLGDFIELLSADARILDAGCGAGLPISKMLAEHFDVTGVDFSEAQIELARQKVPNARFLCEDMTRLNLPEDTFDGICSYYAIIHIPREEHRSLLANFHRMLKTGGMALLCLGAENLNDDIDEDYFGARMYWSHYDSATYLRMLKECGFAIMWARYVKDGDGGHLFVLAQKK